MLTFEGGLLGKEPKGGCSFLSARKKRTKESTHPTKASPRGEDATAPPVALTFRYPRPIKGSGCFLSTTLDAGRLDVGRLNAGRMAVLAA